MIVTTTHSVEGRHVRDYKGVVAGEAILGAHVFRDLFAGIRDIVGGVRALTKNRSARRATSPSANLRKRLRGSAPTPSSASISTTRSSASGAR